MKLVKKDTVEGLQRYLDSCPNLCHFDEEQITFNWSKSGVGFGQLAFITDPGTGEIRCYTEGMSKEFIKEMMNNMIDSCTMI